MSGWHALRALAAALLLLLSSGTASADGSGEASNYDIADLLTRTDEVDVCTRHMQALTLQQLGPDFLPPDSERVTCECMRDSMLHALRDVAPGRPALHNAIIQIAMNLEVMPILLNQTQHPDGMDAFIDFMEQEGEALLGADLDTFNTVMTAAAEQAGKFTPDTIRVVPSCDRTFKMARGHFPEYSDADPGSYDRILALQRLRHDIGVSLFQFDIYLLSETPVATSCLRVVYRVLENDDPDQGHAVRSAAARAACAVLFETLDGEMPGAAETEIDAARRVNVLAWQAFEFQTSSGPDDIPYYLTDRAGQMGVPAEDLHRYFAMAVAMREGVLTPKCPLAWSGGPLQAI